MPLPVCYLIGVTFAVRFLPIRRPVSLRQITFAGLIRPDWLVVKGLFTSLEPRRLIIPDNTMVAARVAQRGVSLVILLIGPAVRTVFLLTFANAFLLRELRTARVATALVVINATAVTLIRRRDLGPLVHLPSNCLGESVQGNNKSVERLIDPNTQDFARLALLRMGERWDLFFLTTVRSMRALSFVYGLISIQQASSRWLFRSLIVSVAFYALGGDGFLADRSLVIAIVLFTERLLFILLSRHTIQRFTFLITIPQ